MKRRNQILLVLLALFLCIGPLRALWHNSDTYRRSQKTRSVIVQLFTLPPGPIPIVTEPQDGISFVKGPSIYAPVGIPFSSQDHDVFLSFWQESGMQQLSDAISSGIPTDIALRKTAPSEVSFSFSFQYHGPGGEENAVPIRGSIQYAPSSGTHTLTQIELEETSRNSLRQLVKQSE